jgi:hypothetical protein
MLDGDLAQIVSVLYAEPDATGFGCRVTFYDAAAAGGSAVGSGLRLQPNAPSVCDITGGATNLYTGNIILSCVASNGDGTNAGTLTIIAEVDSTP